MSATMQIELDANSTNEIRELADILHKTPEETAEEMVVYAMHRARRYAFYLKNAHTATREQGLEILSRMGVGNAPDPGDELPEDLKYLLERRKG